MTATEERTQAPAELSASRHAAMLRSHLMGVIHNAAANDPRNLQRTIGPSEMGDPCQRKIAYKLLGLDETNVPDVWPTTVGTAVHAWLAEVFEAMEARHPGRYQIERRVDPGGTPGSNDLYLQGVGEGDTDDVAVVLDKLTGTVADWKCKGAKGMKRVLEHGPSQGYRVQAHLYGKGQKRAGYDVRWVSIVSLPKDGKLSEMHVWSEEFREDVADWALGRLEAIGVTIASLEIGEHLDRLAAIPAKPSPLCPWCSWFTPRSTDLGRGCPGNSIPS